MNHYIKPEVGHVVRRGDSVSPYGKVFLAAKGGMLVKRFPRHSGLQRVIDKYEIVDPPASVTRMSQLLGVLSGLHALHVRQDRWIFDTSVALSIIGIGQP